MTSGNERLASEPIFSAVLTPHRSLGPRGFRVLMLAFGAVCLGSGVLFLSAGAWPVFGFLGLDVVLLYVAFRLSYRAARAFEEVRVTREEVVLVRHSPDGAVENVRFSSAFVRLGVERQEDEGVTALTLASHGRTEPVGAFLNPADKTSFAVALAAALGAARSGRVMNYGRSPS